MTLEDQILNIAEAPNWYDSRELRAIALEVRKREDRIKQLEEENGAMRADLLLWKYQLEEERGRK